MQKVTKKRIQQLVKNNKVTELFQIYKGNREALYEAINSCGVLRLSKLAYEYAYRSANKYKRCQWLNLEKIYSKQVLAIHFAKEQVLRGTINTSYAKILIEGNNNIYWAHPYYGHRDYNKHKAFENTEENRLLMAKINTFLLRHKRLA